MTCQGELLSEKKLRVTGFPYKVSVCTDIWTKRGMTSSYLGITAHFFSKFDHRKHIVALAVRKLCHPHTAENIRQILEEVLEEWEIPITKLMTDYGSNMVKAFKEQVLTNLMSDDESESEESDVEYD